MCPVFTTFAGFVTLTSFTWFLLSTLPVITFFVSTALEVELSFLDAAFFTSMALDVALSLFDTVFLSTTVSEALLSFLDTWLFVPVFSV